MHAGRFGVFMLHVMYVAQSMCKPPLKPTCGPSLFFKHSFFHSSLLQIFHFSVLPFSMHMQVHMRIHMNTLKVHAEMLLFTRLNYLEHEPFQRRQFYDGLTLSSQSGS